MSKQLRVNRKIGGVNRFERRQMIVFRQSLTHTSLRLIRTIRSSKRPPQWRRSWRSAKRGARRKSAAARNPVVRKRITGRTRRDRGQYPFSKRTEKTTAACTRLNRRLRCRLQFERRPSMHAVRWSCVHDCNPAARLARQIRPLPSSKI